MSAPVLSPVEREAFRRAFKPPFDDLGPAGLCTCDTYPLPIEDHDEECAVRALYEGWLACREWAEEDKARVEIAHGQCSIELVEAGERERVLLEALEGVVEWLQVPDYCRHSDLVAARQALETARAALASPTPQETPINVGAGLLGPPIGPQPVGETTPQETRGE